MVDLKTLVSMVDLKTLEQKLMNEVQVDLITKPGKVTGVMTGYKRLNVSVALPIGMYIDGEKVMEIEPMELTFILRDRTGLIQ